MSDEQEDQDRLPDNIEDFGFVRCATCDIQFGSPLLQKRLKDGDEFYCPVGHGQFFTNARRKREDEAALRKMMLNPPEE